jgi:hypothetical protein
MPDFSEIRELLFGDAALEDWRPRSDPERALAPWTRFEMARNALEHGDRTGAVQALRLVTDAPDLETRQYLQAWHSLRQLGVQPEPDRARHVLGVILEVHLEEGLDTLAAYADTSARYINHGGPMIVWEALDDDISRLIADLLREGQRIADVIGPWTEPRRPPPPRNHVRVNMLTPAGLHFGEGPLAVLSADAMGGPVIAAGTRLMMALIERAKGTTA